MLAKAPMAVGPGGLAYSFCPGKATWDQDTAELFDTCRVTLETGIMPIGGELGDQDAHFAAALPVFVDRWRERAYQRAWSDGGEFLSQVLGSIFKR